MYTHPHAQARAHTCPLCVFANFQSGYYFPNQVTVSQLLSVPVRTTLAVVPPLNCCRSSLSYTESDAFELLLCEKTLCLAPHFLLGKVWTSSLGIQWGLECDTNLLCEQGLCHSCYWFTPAHPHLPIYSGPFTPAPPHLLHRVCPSAPVYPHLSTLTCPCKLTKSHLPINPHPHITQSPGLKFIYSCQYLASSYPCWVKIQLRCSLHSRVFLCSKGRAWHFLPCSQTSYLHVSWLKHILWCIVIICFLLTNPQFLNQTETIHLYP